MKIQIKPFKEIKYEVWSDSEGFIGLCSELQIYDIRIQCMINKITDIYIKFEEKNIYITKSGDFSEFPNGFLDHLSVFLPLILKLKASNYNKDKDYKIEKAVEKYNNYCKKYLL